MRVSFFVPGEPGTKGSARAVPYTGRDGKQHAAVRNDAKRAAPWSASVALAAERAMAGRPPIEGPVRVELVWWVARPKAHYFTGRRAGQLRPDAPMFKATKPDGDKLERCAWDAMTGIVFSDDSRIVTWSGAKPYSVNGLIGMQVTVRAMPAPARSR